VPVAYVDVPAGLNDRAKHQDGRIESVPMRPICTLAVPPGLPLEAKRRLIRRVSDTLGSACSRTVEEIRLPTGTAFRTNWVLTFFWELPLDRVALGDMLAIENPMVLENLPPMPADAHA